MTRRSAAWSAVAKELRVASPILGAALSAIVFSSLLASGHFRGLGILAYMVGAAALGAQSFGHEFTLRTMPSLLMLPQSRRMTMSIKLAVLVALLLPIALFGRFLAFRGFSADRDAEHMFLFWLPLVTAIGVAPWLTLVCRSATAGMAFSLAMPGFVFCGAVLAWVAKHGFTAAPQSFVFRIGWLGTVVISALGLVLGWRSFLNLEAFDRIPELPLPQWLQRTPADVRRKARRFHPLLLLVRKEIGLQRTTVFVAAGYVLGLAILLLMKSLVPDEMSEVLTLIYVLLLPFMAGALASAEEHQFGTFEWQATLPVASWQQWLVKVGVVLGLTIVFAVGVPIALLGFPAQLPLIRLGAAVLMLAAGSLCISSACNTSLWALLSAITVPVVVVPIASFAGPLFSAHAIDMPAGGYRILAGLFVAAAVLTLAMFNHRTVRDHGWLAWRHAAAAVGCAACTALALAIMV